MRQGHITSEDILFGQFELETAGLSEIGLPSEGWWRPDAIHTYHRLSQRQSTIGYEQSDWLSAERQAYGVEPDDEEPE
jgi:hypothetical protein